MKLDNAKDTVAILVGIESYRDDTWTLNGPAMDALRMGQWLLRSGVPGANLRLYLSMAPIADADQSARRKSLLDEMTGAGAQIHFATRADLEHALNPANLPTLPIGSKGSLLVYFSGHGMSSAVTRDRYVITSDACNSSFEVIDLEAQSNSLRLHKDAAGYSTQWWIQDACAEKVGTRSLRRLDVSIQAPSHSETQQVCLFATRPGEYSVNLTERQEGVFTSKLLEILQRLTEAQAGPDKLKGLDIGELYEQLDTHFRAMEQHPVLTLRDEYGANTSLVPGLKTSGPAVEELDNAVRQLPGAKVALLQSVYRGICLNESQPPADIGRMLRQLDAISGDPAAGLSNVELFAVRLQSFCQRFAARTSGHEQTEWQAADRMLGQWIERWPAKRSLPALTQERDRLLRVAGAADRRPSLIVHPGTEPDSMTRVWQYENDKHVKGYHLPTAGKTLEDRLDVALSQLCDEMEPDTVIELVLPHEHLYSYGVGRLIALSPGIPAYVLGNDPLPLVLRVAERWVTPAWRTKWLGRWKATEETLDQPPVVTWPGGPAQQVNAWTWAGHHHVQASDLTPTDALLRAVYGGAPFVAWCAQSQQNTTDEALGRHPYADILLTFQEIARLNASGHRVSCLIDDPSRVPPGSGGPESPLLSSTN